MPSIGLTAGYVNQTAASYIQPNIGYVGAAGTWTLFNGGKRRDVVLERQTLVDMAGAAPYVATARGQEQTIENSEAFIDYLDERGKKGISISRYKGLGEMNAEELWETTMNPDARTLLQVHVYDALQAGELFATLMGDEVEPRRAFIEQNALNVKNLDI